MLAHLETGAQQAALATAPTVEYADFALWQSRQPADTTVLEWWKAKLAHAPAVLTLPHDGPRPPSQGTSAAGQALVRIDMKPISAALRTFSQSEGANALHCLLASWASTLLRRSGQESVVIGVPQSMRESASLEFVVGCFANTLPLHLQFSASGGFRTAVQVVHDELRQMTT